MNLADMTRDERSLLLYFETRMVDYSGRVDTRRMNDDDMEIVDKWKAADFIDYGRIRVADHNMDGSNWVEFSEEAWQLAHQERRARAERGTRRYMKTAETSGATAI